MIERQLVLLSRNPTTSEQETTKIPFNFNTSATYQNIDTAMRSLNSLTTNTYVDTLAINTVSVNEELAG